MLLSQVRTKCDFRFCSSKHFLWYLQLLAHCIKFVSRMDAVAFATSCLTFLTTQRSTSSRSVYLDYFYARYWTATDIFLHRTCYHARKSLNFMNFIIASIYHSTLNSIGLKTGRSKSSLGSWWSMFVIFLGGVRMRAGKYLQARAMCLCRVSCWIALLLEWRGN